MNEKERLQIMAIIIILITAIIWRNIVAQYPNFVFRIVIFGLGFGLSSIVLTLPIIKKAKSLEETTNDV